MHKTASVLYLGDNLTVMRRYLPARSVDLIYIDPPFCSGATYLTSPADGERAPRVAFDDTWRWDSAAESAYAEYSSGDGRPARVLRALMEALGKGPVMAYLCFMLPRLEECRRVLKDDGSFYLHCDDSSSHYLRLLLDAVFGSKWFQNEIVWQRTTAHNESRRYNQVQDTIFFYASPGQFTWNPQYTPYDSSYVEKSYSHTDENGNRVYMLDNLLDGGLRSGPCGQPWRGIDPRPRGKHWVRTPEALDELDKQGRIYWPPRGGVPRLKRFLDEMPGVPLRSIWTDIPPVTSRHSERTGYPTQKPRKLLERIVEASSNPGDTVLDCFSGSGTTLEVCEKMGRRWIGIDQSPVAISTTVKRLEKRFGPMLGLYKVVGVPC